MAIDLDKVPAGARKLYITLGQNFSTERVLLQAAQTLNGLSEYQKELTSEGFIERDAKKLIEAKAQLEETTEGKDQAKTAHSTKGKGYEAALLEGKRLRGKTRSILLGTLDDLLNSGTDAAIAASQNIDSALEQTSLSANDGEGLARQISLLHKSMQLKEAATFIKERTPEHFLKDLSGYGDVLRQSMSARTVRHGTPEHTERLDLLDGMIIRLVRRAREAGIQASKEFGQPAIGEAFKLNKLYTKSSTEKQEASTNPTNGNSTSTGE